eukprot:m.306643 g.306643  ORF g.306643 m.306643 type:complete len:303 (+) comp41449_c0_seq1:307-1215(+)
MMAVATFSPTLGMHQETPSLEDDLPSSSSSPTAFQPPSSPLAWPHASFHPIMMFPNPIQQQQQQQQQPQQQQQQHGMAATSPRRPDKSDKLEVCREYLRGVCNRGEEECRFAHPPADVAVDPSDGMVTVCMDFIKSRCSRDSCRFLHPPTHLQARVKANQLSSPIMTPVFGDAMMSPHLYNPVMNGGMMYEERPLLYPFFSPPMSAPGNPYLQPMFVFPPSSAQQVTGEPGEYSQPLRSPKNENRMQPVCRDFMSGKCERPNCRYIHLSDTNVEVIDGKVTICRDAVKGRCSRTHCKYFHMP